MLKTTVTISIISLALVASIAACNSQAAEETKAPAADSARLIKRGEYLVNTIGCDDCHSPKRMGAKGPEIIPELRLSGYPSNRPVLKADSRAIKQGWTLIGSDLTCAAGPWGMTFAANITSDASGIGNWKEEQFIKALREGKSKGLDNTRPLLPTMPWTSLRNLTDEDLKSVFAYLKSTRPVKNIVPEPIQPAGLN